MKTTRYVAIKEIEHLPEDIKELNLEDSWFPWINCESTDTWEQLARIALHKYLRESGVGEEPRTIHVFITGDRGDGEKECGVFTMRINPCHANDMGAITLI